MNYKQFLVLLILHTKIRQVVDLSTKHLAVRGSDSRLVFFLIPRSEKTLLFSCAKTFFVELLGTLFSFC